MPPFDGFWLLFSIEKKLVHKGSRKIKAFAEIFWEEEQRRSAGASSVLGWNDRSKARCDDGVRNRSFLQTNDLTAFLNVRQKSFYAFYFKNITHVVSVSLNFYTDTKMYLILFPVGVEISFKHLSFNIGKDSAIPCYAVDFIFCNGHGHIILMIIVRIIHIEWSRFFIFAKA